MSATWRRAVIALGSNLGDRSATIASAREAMAADPHIRVELNSSLYRSIALKPEGADPNAPEYLNAVTTVTTDYEPGELLGALMQIERDHGRVREQRWGDRTLDLDIIDISGVSLQSEELTVPHPSVLERDFVCAPWLEIEPDARLNDALLREHAPEATHIVIAEVAR